MIGLVCALAAALCYGVGSVLQAAAVRGTTRTETLDPRLLLRMSRSWPYVLGVGLDGAGFLLALVAVRSLPLFVVQSVVAGFLAVTAVLGAVFLHNPLRAADRVALAVVVTGLVLLGLSASADGPVSTGPGLQWGVLVASVVLVVLAVGAGRLRGSRSAVALGAVGGLAFGATSVGARVFPAPPGPFQLWPWVTHTLAQPSAWAVALAGVLALLSYSTALQRGSVIQATAPVVVAETVAPALVGVLLLGDRPRSGWEAAALVGFSLALGGTLSLSRFGEASAHDSSPEHERTA